MILGKLRWRWLGLVLAGTAMWVARSGAAEAVAGAHDALVYKDGDRVQGRLVSRDGGVIVFKSDRFGELRVPAADAVVIMAEKPKATAPAPASAAAGGTAVAGASAKPAGAVPAGKTAAERDEEERMTIWERFSPWVLTAQVRNFFGPWHGRLALSTETVADSTDRKNSSVDATLRRKWERDEVQLNGRF